MPGQHKTNPAPALNGKLANMLLSFGAFYKRDVTLEDVRVINPTAIRDKTDFHRVLTRLERENMITVSGETYRITEFGLVKLHDHATYRREMIEKELARRGRAANLASKAKRQTPHH